MIHDANFPIYTSSLSTVHAGYAGLEHEMQEMSSVSHAEQYWPDPITISEASGMSIGKPRTGGLRAGHSPQRKNDAALLSPCEVWSANPWAREEQQLNIVLLDDA